MNTVVFDLDSFTVLWIDALDYLCCPLDADYS